MSTHPDNSPEVELESRKRDKLSFLSRKSSKRFIPPDLKIQALKDLSKRSRGGIFVYLPVWLFIAYWYDLVSSNSSLFWINTTILVLLVIARLFHLRWIHTRAAQHTKVLYDSLVLLILANALHWGVLSAWLISHSEFVELHYVAIILLTAFALGGTVIMSVSRVARVLYPILIFSPSLLTKLTVAYTSEHYMLSVLAIFSTLFIIHAARVAGDDYWKAVIAHRDAMESAEQLEQLSTIDALTLLDNRLSFKKRYLEEWNRSRRYETELCVLMIDLDRLKHINDTYGHLFGDECLRKVAATFRVNIPRQTDIVARYGGDEFVVMLSGAGLNDAERIAERLVRQTAEIEVHYENDAVPLSCSIGIACTIPGREGDIDSLLHRADKALYTAKANGRNQWSSSCSAANATNQAPCKV